LIIVCVIIRFTTVFKYQGYNDHVYTGTNVWNVEQK